MELFMKSHTGLDNAGGMEVECRWNAGGMELSLRCCQEWITMPVEWIFLGLSRRLDKECSWNGILLGVLSRVG